MSSWCQGLLWSYFYSARDSIGAIFTVTEILLEPFNGVWDSVGAIFSDGDFLMWGHFHGVSDVFEVIFMALETRLEPFEGAGDNIFWNEENRNWSYEFFWS